MRYMTRTVSIDAVGSDAVRPYILAVDPGRAVGICLVQRDGLVCLYKGELDWKEMARYISEVFLDLGDKVDVVVEAFRISINTAKNAKGAVETMECIGMVRLLCRQYKVNDGDSMALQTSADAQAFTDGAKLRALGWWYRGGGGHANMALRHAALRLLRTGCRDAALLGLDTQEIS
jgi:hypothetical protein